VTGRTAKAPEGCNAALAAFDCRVFVTRAGAASLENAFLFERAMLAENRPSLFGIKR